MTGRRWRGESVYAVIRKAFNVIGCKDEMALIAASVFDAKDVGAPSIVTQGTLAVL